ANYQGSTTGTFVITQANVSFNFSNLTQTYTGAPLSPTVTTSPSLSTTGGTINTFSATNAGTYSVTYTLSGAQSYQGSATTSFTIRPAPLSASVMVTPLYYSAGTTLSTNPPPAVCGGASGPCQKYSDPVNFMVSIPPTLAGTSALSPTTCGGTTAPCVNVSVGSQTYGPLALTVDPTTNTLTGTLQTVRILQAPSSSAYTVKVSPVSTVDPNYSISTAASSLLVKPETAILTYSGLTDFTTNSGAQTQNITVVYTFQDPTATGVGSATYDPFAGNITKASPTLTFSGTTSAGKSFTKTSNPSVVATMSVNGVPATGTATYVVPNVPVNGSYTLSASATSGSYYTWNTASTNVAITNGNDGGGSIKAHGAQTAEYLAASDPANGKYAAAGLLIPAPGTKLEFDLDGKYDKQGINAKGKITLQAGALPNVISPPVGKAAKPPKPPKPTPTPKPPKPPKDLHNYEIDVDSIESLTIEPPFEKWVSTATIRDMSKGGGVVAQDVQLQIVMDAAAGDGRNSTFSVQITDDTNGLWFSNNWSGVDTPISETAPLIQEGEIKVQ
ncbi:MAG TPA: MBG domain-containing protein, partial [Candidatus Udaeobacter sp.]